MAQRGKTIEKNRLEEARLVQDTYNKLFSAQFHRYTIQDYAKVAASVAAMASPLGLAA